MPNFKIVISDPKTRKAYQKEVDQGQSGLVGKKIGEVVSGNNLGLAGYDVEITGGSDRQGFPMRKDVEGIARKKILIALPPGFHPKMKGQRKRKSIRGNTISAEISQINTKVIKYGTKTLEELIGVKEKPKEEKQAEGKKKESKEEAKPEKQAEEKKEGPKTEEKSTDKHEEQAKKAEAKIGVKTLEDKEKETKKEK